MRKAAALALGIASMMGATVPVTAQSTPTQVQQRITDQKQPVDEVKPVRRQNKFSGFAPGYDIIPPGIPPHIYGMYHVKKGTHKRTNK